MSEEEQQGKHKHIIIHADFVTQGQAGTNGQKVISLKPLLWSSQADWQSDKNRDQVWNQYRPREKRLQVEGPNRIFLLAVCHIILKLPSMWESSQE